MRAILSVVAMLLLGGCLVTVPTNPNNYSIDPKTVSHLQAGQAVALINGYKDPSPAQMRLRGVTLEIERRQLTETAITMLTRALEKQGVKVSPDASKKVALRVVPVGVTSAAFRWTGRIVLQGKLGDGREVHIPQESLSPKGWENAFDGAVLFALNELVEHEYFVAYMNR